MINNETKEFSINAQFQWFYISLLKHYIAWVYKLHIMWAFVCSTCMEHQSQMLPAWSSSRGKQPKTLSENVQWCTLRWDYLWVNHQHFALQRQTVIIRALLMFLLLYSRVHMSYMMMSHVWWVLHDAFAAMTQESKTGNVQTLHYANINHCLWFTWR